MTVLTMNEKLNGIEVKFDSKPARETLDTLKGAGFRWSSRQGFWYAKNTPERLQVAEAIADGKKAEPAKVEQKTDRQKELKAVYADFVKKEVWPNDEEMQNYEAKNAAYIVELSNGDLIPLDRPRIETRFCFAYGQNGVSTVEEQRGAYEMAQKAATDADYFKEQNMKELNDKIESLRKCLEDREECYTFVKYNRQPDDSTIKDYSTTTRSHNPENVPGYWSNCRSLKKASVEDVQRILNGLEEVKKGFEKRLNTYLKRYGTSKLNTWAFLSD